MTLDAAKAEQTAALDSKGVADGLSSVVMASSICAYTSEEALLNHPYCNSNSLHNLYKVIARSLASCKQAHRSVPSLKTVLSGFEKAKLQKEECSERGIYNFLDEKKRLRYPGLESSLQDSAGVVIQPHIMFTCSDQEI
ncbi:hypothetical protein D5086_013955 [Populus alba]|uniref:Uncharacterized protein n=1 Tax=Populus alba TaxID=43335 RepID=A0ACC4C7Z4_POPAL